MRHPFADHLLYTLMMYTQIVNVLERAGVRSAKVEESGTEYGGELRSAFAPNGHLKQDAHWLITRANGSSYDLKLLVWHQDEAGEDYVSIELEIESRWNSLRCYITCAVSPNGQTFWNAWGDMVECEDTKLASVLDTINSRELGLESIELAAEFFLRQ